MLLSVDNACLAFGHVALLDHANLQIDEGERIAFIGRNGSGKSSLMRAIAGLGTLDDGRLWRRDDLRVGYVEQEPLLDGHDTVWDAVAAGLGQAQALLVEYHRLARRVGESHDPALLDQLHAVQTQLEQADAWRLNTRIELVLGNLGLDGDVAVATLSGGLRKRVALAQALAADPELLLLDEPTNHLDLDGILWLENLISGFAGAVLLITHDRRFLDRVASRIVELDRGRLQSYPGRFADYQRRKAEELAAEAQSSARFDKLLAQEEVWIRKGVEARRTRNEGRVRRLEALRIERSARREQQGRVDLSVERGERSGRLVAELEGVCKAFGARTVARDFSCRIQRGDKLGIIGPNGAGKTTLLKLILGQLQPDAGQLKLGTKLSVAYFDQFRAQLPEDAALTEVVSPGSEFIEIGGRRTHVIGYLGEFLFSPERARSPVKTLSGGERARLLLARLFSRPANVIVLDEPTNDLDLETLELLETLLQEYDGTVFLVSHDREFLDNVVTQVIVAEDDGRWGEYVGGYGDWVRQRKAAQAANSARSAAKSGVARSAKRNEPAKMSFKETRELGELPERIAALEAEQQAVSAALADPDLYRQPADRSRELKQQLADLNAEIEAAMLRWEALEQRAAATR